MNRTTISEQLQNDYPDYTIKIDAARMLVVIDDHEMKLLNSPSELQAMNIFSRSGRNFYQAVTQLISSLYGIAPQEGTYADSLVVRQEDITRARLQKMAGEYGIGFLEDDKKILAVEVDDGTRKPLLLENNSKTGEQEGATVIDVPAIEEDDWAELEEITFESEIAYLEKGIEFVASMEELKELKEVDDSADEMQKSLPGNDNTESTDMHTGKRILDSIRKVFGLSFLLGETINPLDT